MKLTSQAFSHGDSIPKQFTCEGQNISPELSWTDAPKETKSLVLILQDPDAPKQNGIDTNKHDRSSNNQPYRGKCDQEYLRHRPRAAGQTALLIWIVYNDCGAVPAPGSHRYFARLPCA